MGVAYPLVTSWRTIRALDFALAAWVAVWVVLGVWTGLEMRQLKRLSDTVVASSEVLHETAEVLRTLQDLPVVGERVGDAEQAVGKAAESARSSGRASRNTIDVLSVLLGVSIVLIPTIPFVGLYVPMRIAWAREVRAVRSAMAEAGDDRTFREFLARRAAENLGYHQLREVETNPWRALEEGRFDGLSEAELRRLGIKP